jgi:hypothetical protein
MTRLELRGVAIGVCKQVEVVHIVDDKGTIAGGLEGRMGLVFAKDGGLPLGGEKGKVCISVVDNVIPALSIS